MTARTVEIFLTCCLDGDARVIARILRKNRKSWTGIISSNSLDINCVDSSSRSGLSLACIANNKEVVDLLLSRADLDVNRVDIFGATSLMYASKNVEGKDVVKLLLERKDIDVDEKDQDGKTAEDYATEGESIEIVQLIRDERSKRMGSVWTRPETIMAEENGSETEDSQDEELQIVVDVEENIDFIQCKEEAEEVCRQLEKQDVSMDGDEFFKTELVVKLNDRIAKENSDIAQKEDNYSEVISRIEEDYEVEKLRIEQMMKQKMEDLESNFLAKKKTLEESHLKEKEKSDLLISRLTTARDNFDMTKLLQQSNSYSELECPVCLEEMKPPVRIWQCLSGHAVCELCRKSPQVRDCPTCRQKIVGRNILAEKLARSLYGNV